METLPVWTEAGALAHALALRISRAAGTDYVLLADPADTSAAHTRSWRLARVRDRCRDVVLPYGREGRLTRAAMVDGARMRFAGGSRVWVTLPAPAPTSIWICLANEARLSGSSWGARVQVGSQAVPVAVERRSCARGRAAGRSH